MAVERSRLRLPVVRCGAGRARWVVLERGAGVSLCENCTNIVALVGLSSG